MRAPVPHLEFIVAGVCWTVGAAALDSGPGTVVLAAGLGVTGALIAAVHRRPHAVAAAPPGGRRRLVRVLVVTLAAVAAIAVAVDRAGYGELTVPLACAVLGVALLVVSAVLEERSPLAAGGVLMVLGAAGAVLALDSAGRLYPHGVVGLVAGAVLWVTGAHRTGLIAEARGRARR